LGTGTEEGSSFGDRGLRKDRALDTGTEEGSSFGDRGLRKDRALRIGDRGMIELWGPGSEEGSSFGDRGLRKDRALWTRGRERAWLVPATSLEEYRFANRQASR
jgi:hypothetical protein